MNNRKYDIGVDLGGTNIAIGIVNCDGKILCKDSVPTDLPRSPESIVDAIYDLTEDLLHRKHLSLDDCTSIGIGIPGTVNAEAGVVEYANNFGFTNVSFVKLLKDRFPIKVYAENDAAAAAIGEYAAGAGKGTHSMVMITLGTGVGGGIIIDGRCWHGINSAAGELGHMVIHHGGRQCTCGRKGCFEAYASATALVDRVETAVRKSIEEYQKSDKDMGCDREVSVLASDVQAGQHLSGKKIIEAVKSGDPIAKKEYESYLEDLAVGTANIINILQPECLIIGGGLSGIGEELLLKPLTSLVKPMVYSRYSSQNTSIRLAKLGNDAGIIGAARINGGSL